MKRINKTKGTFRTECSFCISQLLLHCFQQFDLELKSKAQISLKITRSFLNKSQRP